jgi:hypothetical protein
LEDCYHIIPQFVIDKRINRSNHDNLGKNSIIRQLELLIGCLFSSDFSFPRVYTIALPAIVGKKSGASKPGNRGSGNKII